MHYICFENRIIVFNYGPREALLINFAGTGTYLAIFCYLARNGMILTLQLGAAM